MFPVPVDGLEKAGSKVGLRAEAKFALGFRDLEAAPRLSVGLARVPSQLAAKAGEFANQFGERPNRDLASGADVDGRGLFVKSCSHDDGARAILDIEKFPAGGAGAPQIDMIGARLDRIATLLDQRGNHMRLLGIERIAWSIQVHQQQAN